MISRILFKINTLKLLCATPLLLGFGVSVFVAAGEQAAFGFVVSLKAIALLFAGLPLIVTGQLTGGGRRIIESFGSQVATFAFILFALGCAMILYLSDEWYSIGGTLAAMTLASWFVNWFHRWNYHQNRNDLTLAPSPH